MSQHTYSKRDIGKGDFATVCDDCGEFVINKPGSDVKHSRHCIPGDAERWKEHYSQPNPTTDEEDEQIVREMESY